ncbi:uncharacterized protein LOC122086885 [Macadamia integrifolia]|uniref:uncharacterized protein LOC122086885 n=1 Tax=Macadamia integrifolia TaxID=60698 RepID=UPI001C4F0F6C|nr:uncharacterized protein LOC122086885 [Macadamia integrifolia]
MEPSPPATVAKKLWNIVRIVFFMVRKGISKRKLMMDLHLMVKRGKIAGKAIGNLLSHHHSNFTCRSFDADLSFVSPREYEFSCSNSPAYPFYSSSSSSQFPFHVSKRKHSHCRYFSSLYPTATADDDLTTVDGVKRMLEMLNVQETTEASPIPSSFPGFGRSPMGRQLKITDSPFPLRDADEDTHVDKAAEEFIKKFYKDLRRQNRMAAMEA